MKELCLKVTGLEKDIAVKIELDKGALVITLRDLDYSKLEDKIEIFTVEQQNQQKGLCIQTKDEEIESIYLINDSSISISYNLCTDENGRIEISKFTTTEPSLLAADDINSMSVYWNKYCISNNLKDFYKDIAASKRAESWQELLNLDGQVILDLSNYKNKETMQYINCMNNPYYFIDMLGWKFDIGSYMAIRTHIHGNCVSLELPAAIVDYQPIILAYAAWKLLFTDELVLIPIEDSGKLEAIIDSVPEFLHCKTYEDVNDNILFTKEDLAAERECNTNSIVNTFYIDKDYVEDMEFTDHTLIAADFLTAKTYYDPIIEKLGVKQNPFKQIKFNMFDLGFDFDKAEELFAYEDESLETFLKKYVL